VITPQAISVDTGDSWRGAIFDKKAGDLLALRRKPEQSILCYHLFEPQGE
jgi:hypothetical protein